jgi:hypothetical protein
MAEVIGGCIHGKICGREVKLETIDQITISKLGAASFKVFSLSPFFDASNS